MILFVCQSGFIISNTLSQVWRYSTAVTDEAAYIIGGYQGSDYSPIIAEFKNEQWRKLGDLTQGRQYHGSISVGDQAMIVGGATRSE